MHDLILEHREIGGTFLVARTAPVATEYIAPNVVDIEARTEQLSEITDLLFL
jgi:hypothetical protein